MLDSWFVKYNSPLKFRKSEEFYFFFCASSSLSYIAIEFIEISFGESDRAMIRERKEMPEKLLSEETRQSFIIFHEKRIVMEDGEYFLSEMLLYLRKISHQAIDGFWIIRIYLIKKRDNFVSDIVSHHGFFCICRVGDKSDLFRLAMQEYILFLDMKERTEDVIIYFEDTREPCEFRASEEIEKKRLDRIIEMMGSENIVGMMLFSNALEERIALISCDFLDSELLHFCEA